jgi:hypothetical protein
MPDAASQLAALARQFDDATARALRLGQAAGFEKRPAPARWSAAECVEHLNLTTRAYLPRIEPGLRELRSRNQLSRGPYRMELMPRFLNWLLEPPVRLKMPTSAPFQPAEIADPTRVVPDFVELQQRLLDLLRQSEGLAIDAFKIHSPFAESVRYNLYSAFVLTATHQRRHLWQAERI